MPEYVLLQAAARVSHPEIRAGLRWDGPNIVGSGLLGFMHGSVSRGINKGQNVSGILFLPLRGEEGV